METRRPVKDRAKRATEIVNAIWQDDPAGTVRGWVAIRISDGGSDKTLYDTREDAVTHQLHETQCAYLQMPWGGITAVEMDSFLNTQEWFYDHGPKLGIKLSDPEARMSGITQILRTARKGLGL